MHISSQNGYGNTLYKLNVDSNMGYAFLSQLKGCKHIFVVPFEKDSPTNNLLQVFSPRPRDGAYGVGVSAGQAVKRTEMILAACGVCGVGFLQGNFAVK